MPVDFRERYHSQVLSLLLGLSWGRDVLEVTVCVCIGVSGYEPVNITNMNCWQNERNRAQQLFFFVPVIAYYNYIFELTTFI